MPSRLSAPSMISFMKSASSSPHSGGTSVELEVCALTSGGFEASLATYVPSKNATAINIGSKSSLALDKLIQPF